MGSINYDFSVIRFGRNDIFGALKSGEFLLNHLLIVIICMHDILGFDTM